MFRLRSALERLLGSRGRALVLSWALLLMVPGGAWASGFEFDAVVLTSGFASHDGRLYFLTTPPLPMELCPNTSPCLNVSYGAMQGDLLPITFEGLPYRSVLESFGVPETLRINDDIGNPMPTFTFDATVMYDTVLGEYVLHEDATFTAEITRPVVGAATYKMYFASDESGFDTTDAFAQSGGTTADGQFDCGNFFNNVVLTPLPGPGPAPLTGWVDTTIAAYGCQVAGPTFPLAPPFQMAFNMSVIPEPSTFLTVSLGLAGLALAGGRRRRSA